jgi:hypothetical protein
MRSRHFALILLASTTLLLGGKKKNIAALEEVLVGHPAETHQVGAPADIQPMQWEPGQWSLYKRTDKKGRVSVEKLSIVDKDACGYQVESIQWTEQGKTGTRICYAEMPVAWSAHEAIEVATDLVRVLTTWNEGSEPMTIDFSTPEGAMMRGMMRVIGHGMMSTLRIDIEGGGETVTVPAGTFAGTIHVNGKWQLGPLKIQVEGRAHPAVPINGSVRVEARDGSKTELVDFGLTGAVRGFP